MHGQVKCCLSKGEERRGEERKSFLPFEKQKRKGNKMPGGTQVPLCLFLTKDSFHGNMEYAPNPSHFKCKPIAVLSYRHSRILNWFSSKQPNSRPPSSELQGEGGPTVRHSRVSFLAFLVVWWSYNCAFCHWYGKARNRSVIARNPMSATRVKESSTGRITSKWMCPPWSIFLVQSRNARIESGDPSEWS